MYAQLQSNWGGEEDGPCPVPESLSQEEEKFVTGALQGKTLQQILERVFFTFRVNNCTRACTHQLVRTRLGCAIMQHGGRDNDWRHRGWTLPETIARVSERLEHHVNSGGEPHVREDGLTDCLNSDLKTPQSSACNLLNSLDGLSLEEYIVDFLEEGKWLYSRMVDAGIPWQDARRVLPMGTQTYIELDYNFPALQGVMMKRMEFIMDWEINCVAQLMLREIILQCPPELAVCFRSASDRLGKAAFAELDSWPPDGKYPVNAETAARPRCHRAEQNPFWVLHPESYRPRSAIVWIPTNGTYPHDAIQAWKRSVETK